MKPISAFGVTSNTSPIEAMTIERREVTDYDVQIAIDYCGICHSDIHQARNEWGFSHYPLVPGHEIIGHVTAVGSKVTKHKVGDTVGVGVMVDSCRECSECQDDLEQFCAKKVGTYNGEDFRHGGITFGGYAKEMVVQEHFVLRIPDNLDKQAIAPLLCAGITTWSPLQHWHIKQGDTVGVIGLGGLGHMGVKFAHALGAKVVMITRSANKGKDAQALGADEVLLSTDETAMADNAKRFDFLLNTVPVSHELDPYMTLLKRDGTMVCVGMIEPLTNPLNMANLVLARRSIAGSIIGGIKETQAMLDFCGKHNITADVEMIKPEQINQAFERTINGDVKYRFVIDMR